MLERGIMLSFNPLSTVKTITKTFQIILFATIINKTGRKIQICSFWTVSLYKQHQKFSCPYNSQIITSSENANSLLMFSGYVRVLRNGIKHEHMGYYRIYDGLEVFYDSYISNETFGVSRGLFLLRIWKKHCFAYQWGCFWLLEIISWFLNKKIVARIISKLSILYGLIRSPFQGIFILKAKLRLDGVGQPHGITTACFEFSLCFALFLPLKGDPVTTSRFFIHHLKDTTRLYDKIHACLKFEWSLYDNYWSNWRHLTFGVFFRHP